MGFTLLHTIIQLLGLLSVLSVVSASTCYDIQQQPYWCPAGYQLSTGARIGISLGCIVGGALLVLLVVYGCPCCGFGPPKPKRTRRAKTRTRHNNSADPDPPPPYEAEPQQV